MLEGQLAPEEKMKKTNDKSSQKTSDKSSSVVRKKLSDGDDNNKKVPKKEPGKTVLMWLIIAIVVVLALKSFDGVGAPKEIKMTYTQFQEMLANPEIKISEARVTQKGLNRAEFHGVLQDSSSINKIQSMRNTAPSKSFLVNLPFIDTDIISQWQKAGFNYTFEQEKMNWADVMISVLPWLLFVFFLMFFFRQMQAGQKGIFSFGKSKAKLQSMDRPQNTFADAAGVEEAKAELQEIIDFLKDSKKFKRLGGKIPKGVLLLGPPGTGKTLLARCVAGEAGVPFLSMSGSDFVEMFVGVGASRVRDLFDTAKRNSPCIIFIDEIDAVGRQRGAGVGGGHDEREQTLNQMLVEMDGFEVNSGVILIAATNRPDVLDPALLRPGRFDRQIVVDVPDVKGREGILKVHTKNLPLAPDVDLHTIARGTPGFVGADLANIVNEAALMAARFGQDLVTMLDFEEAKDRVMMGAERKSMVLSDKEKQLTAYHEAGHAICNIYCKEADPLHKVTIIPRGRALGVTFSLPFEDKHSYTKQYILDKICIMLGGRMAEEIIFQNQTTGASSDIKQATGLVRKLICDYGMTDELGPISYGEKDEQIFLGREISRHRDYSDKTAEEIDAMMRKIIEEQVQRSKEIINGHREELDLLANALLEHELLDREEILKVISGDTLLSAKKTRNILKKENPDSTVTPVPEIAAASVNMETVQNDKSGKIK
jgi:cell division protease FtsH